VYSTFETFEPGRKFDCIHMGGMLKHLDDPVALLRRSREWLSPKGRLIATTPNARSLHRRVGVYMGFCRTLAA
jgi:2-polyprenyl-3-methyl-5-hydroxy-6-metoxy-1,4-benzoquinol methylase